MVTFRAFQVGVRLLDDGVVECGGWLLLNLAHLVEQAKNLSVQHWPARVGNTSKHTSEAA